MNMYLALAAADVEGQVHLGQNEERFLAGQ
jgi:hypothetical protein